MDDEEYFNTIAEIDYWFFALEEQKLEILERSPIEIMIDKSTGYDKKQLKEIKRIVNKIKKLQGKLPEDDYHFHLKKNKE